VFAQNEHLVIAINPGYNQKRMCELNFFLILQRFEFESEKKSYAEIFPNSEIFYVVFFF